MKNFEALTGSMGMNSFVNDIYGKRVVVLPHERDWFDSTFGLSDLNHILNFVPLTYPRVRATDHVNSVHKYDLIRDQDRYANNRNDDLEPEKLVRAIARGATLVIDRVQQLSRQLEEFIDGLSQDLGFGVSCNAYYTAPNTLGVNAHFDRHDVFAIQLHGEKRWFYREAPHDLAKPIRSQASPSVPENREGWSSVLLTKGDVFYCPRGVWHFTETGEHSSAHLAIGFHPPTLQDLLDRLCKHGNLPQLLERYVAHSLADGSNKLSEDLLELFIQKVREASRELSQIAQPGQRPHIDLD